MQKTQAESVPLLLDSMGFIHKIDSSVFEPLSVHHREFGVISKIRIHRDLAAVGKLSERRFFDDQGRRIETRHSVGGQTVRTETMSYNSRGELEKVTNDEGTIRYLYDDLGRQTEVAFSSSDFTGDNVTNFENITRFTYDELGRLKTVTAIERNDQLVDVDSGTAGNQADVTTYEYDLVGNLDKTIYVNNLIHDYDYDSLNRLDKLTHFLDNDEDGTLDEGEQLAIFDYDVRADGKRTSVPKEFSEQFWNDAGGTFASPDHQNDFDWTYDDIGRLIGESLDSSDDTLDYVDSFVWDLNGNRKSTTRDWGDASGKDYTTSYVYDANDRLTTETKDYVSAGDPDETVTYGYDQTQQTSKTTVIDGKTTSVQTFEYNLQGRMSSVTIDKYSADGTVIVSSEVTIYEYDSQGNRVATEHKVDSDADGDFDTETRTEYLTDNQNHTGYSQVLTETEFDANGDATNKIIYTLGHDQISQTIFEHDGSSWDSGTTHYFGTDGHGSVRALYDLAGAVVNDVANSIVQVYHYDAHGNLLNFPAGITPLTSYLYSGEAFDHNIGQQYLRARWYDATNGRFNRLDPFFGNLEAPQSLHKYLYVHGDPVMGVDPSGQFLVTVALGSIGVWGLRTGSITPKVAAIGFAAGILSDATAILWIRSALIRDLGEQLPHENKNYWSNRTAVRVSDSKINARQAFEMLASFDQKYFKSTVVRPNRWSESGNDYVTFSFTLPMSVGQRPFEVKIDQFDEENRFLSVVTLNGHPLSGFRYFRIIANSDMDKSFTIETGAIDHPAFANDYTKMIVDYWGGDGLLKTWTNSFEEIAKAAGGTSELVENRWIKDTTEKNQIKRLVNWRTK